MSESVEEVTNKYYDEHGRSWASGHQDQNFWADALKEFSKLLPKGKIIEIGSGGGRDAEMLISMGYDYIGTDVSQTLLEVAQENNPGARFVYQSVYELNFPNEKFDGFWTAATLLHIPKSRIDEALQSIKNVLKDDAVGFISLKEGEREEIVDQYEGKRFFAFYSMEEFEEVLKRNNFEVLWKLRQPVSENTIWLQFIVRNRSDD